ncbi:hypothetical protein CHARACLAT_026009 [Characodon lateralis]|uniref:Nuclease HARBI1 n=1 Tax=Characodon lateralis TaxID=208331 RepID=A0ABU7F6J0_9TELE|nr:hypothetical protein [Characodon lateralis]
MRSSLQFEGIPPRDFFFGLRSSSIVPNFRSLRLTVRAISRLGVWLSGLATPTDGDIKDEEFHTGDNFGFRAIFLQSLEVHHTFVPHVITACAILHNICLGAGDVMAPEDDPEEAVEEDEGEVGLRQSAVLSDRTSFQLRCLLWRSDVAAVNPASPLNPLDGRYRGQWKEASQTSADHLCDALLTIQKRQTTGLS